MHGRAKMEQHEALAQRVRIQTAQAQARVGQVSPALDLEATTLAAKAVRNSAHLDALLWQALNIYATLPRLSRAMLRRRKRSCVPRLRWRLSSRPP